MVYSLNKIGCKFFKNTKVNLIELAESDVDVEMSALYLWGSGDIEPPTFKVEYIQISDENESTKIKSKSVFDFYRHSSFIGLE